MAAATRSSSARSAIWSVVLILAVVLVFTVLLFEFGNFGAPRRDSVLGAALHVRRVLRAA